MIWAINSIARKLAGVLLGGLRFRFYSRNLSFREIRYKTCCFRLAKEHEFAGCNGFKWLNPLHPAYPYSKSDESKNFSSFSNSIWKRPCRRNSVSGVVNKVW